MGQETELKLLIAPSDIEPFMASEVLAAQSPQYLHLVNRYFDTPDRALTQAGMALRLRYKGGQWLQTLKTAGSPGKGLNERQEWEMPVAGEALELKRLPSGVLPDSANWSNLKPAFETNFERREWTLERGNNQIEVVLDQGRVEAGEQAELLCEVELELKRGQASAVFELAAELAKGITLMPSDISKAERGFRRLDTGRPDWPDTPDPSAPHAVWLHAVSRQLEALPNSASALTHSLLGLAQRGDAHIGFIQSLMTGLADNPKHWYQLPDACRLGRWLIHQNHQVWQADQDAA